jgi:Mrp family chromosome partitioning ATPase
MTIPFNYQEVEQIYAKTFGTGIRSLTVTSSQGNEGTTSIVCALAQRAMAVKLRVLVVDLNLYNPSVSRLLEQAGDSQDHWYPLANHTPQRVQIDDGPGFSVIPAPLGDKGPMRLREESLLSSLVECWLQDYDLVIFDTSPLCLVNRQNVPAQLVASCSDGAIIAVQTGKTDRTRLSDAVETLKSLNINLLGTVINDNKNPSLGAELVRQCCKLAKWLPRVADYLIGKINGSKFLFARF